MAERILIVDDEALILTAVERALVRVGYTIAKAQSVKELGEALKKAPFDLLITDIYMQEITINEVIERVRETSPAVKVLKMSGSANKEEDGNFLEKPFSIEALRQQVKDILNGSS
jgi:DNA-binding NtrC family response regulator